MSRLPSFAFAVFLAAVQPGALTFAQSDPQSTDPTQIPELPPGKNPPGAILHKCGTPTPDQMAAPRGAGAQSDCDLFNTNPSGAYAPSVRKYRIPVVVHVIKKSNGQGDISPQDVREQIEMLNQDFLALPGSLGANGNDAQIEFYLATEDPSGNPTEGIHYVVNDSFFNENGSYWLSNAWNPHKYMNVYTLDIPTSNLLGYVPALPQTGVIVGTAADRIVIDYTCFGPSALPPNELGRTLTHEVGHYLGLEHVFEGSCGASTSPDCYSEGDLICDTPPQAAEYFGCTPGTSCGSAIDLGNYMNYTDDWCMNHFSPEQVRRMRCTLENWRPMLAEIDTTTGLLTVSPNGVVTHSGIAGGPFDNPSTNYTIANPGQGAIDYRVSLTEGFGILLNGQASPLTGTLNGGGGSLNVQVTLGPDVNSLAPGNYVETIVFEDLTNNTALTRQHEVFAGWLTRCSSTTAVDIPDNSVVGVSRSINFTEDAIVSDLNISLSISHDWLGDIVVDLTHVDTGTTVRLIDRMGSNVQPVGCGGETLSVTLDDAGGPSIEDTCFFTITSPPSYKPNNPLSAFNGENIAGEWRLKVSDVAIPTFTGAFGGWCMGATVTANTGGPGPGPAETDTDGDGVADTIDNCPSDANPTQADSNGNGVGDACDTVGSAQLALADCPADISQQATSAQGAIVEFELPQTTGGVGNVTVLANPKSGTVFPIGDTTVTVSAFDASNQSTQCTFLITITTGGASVPNPPPSEACCGGGTGTAMMPLALLAIGLYWRRRR